MFKALMANIGWKKSKKTVKKITLGICAMDKKAKSKPMREILQRLPEELFTIVYFGDECILNQPIESWPVVEVLISFFSKGFPTNKALEYVKLRKPYLINDLEMEGTLGDRRKVYNLLKSQNIDVPRHVFVSRDDPNIENVLEEFDEYIIVNGEQMNKPFVEKPVDADDHNIYIYYPSSAGGGSKRLFRKVDDRSSEFYPGINEVRREGSYIYEEFVITQGSDVKVYTVGPEYGHAEARKSPVVDGRVKRDSDGLEVRYPVILSHVEKDMARKVVTAFRQTVCGFDILRVKGKSYCCDVNGFSFVKNSRKYYEDASQILTEIMLNQMRPEYNSTLSTRAPLVRPVLTKEKLSTLGTTKARGSIGQSLDQLGNVSAAPSPVATAITNGNFNSNGIAAPTSSGQLNASSADDAMSVSDFNDAYSSTSGIPNPSVRKYDQEELRCVIAVMRHGDRTPKQKMKIKVTEAQYLDYFHFYAKTPRKELKVKSKSGLVKFLEVTRDILAVGPKSTDPELRRKLCQIRDVLERWEISGINRKLQMKPQKWSDEASEGSKGGAEGEDGLGQGLATELILILKWGGDLTPLGRQQAEHLGSEFRHKFYPDTEGGGVLRLHATYRHDLKIKASDEGRVMKTAAAFTKGLLELEGQLTPILASLVTVEDNRQMLDRGGNFEIEDDMDRCKEHLNLLQVETEVTDGLVDMIAPGCSLAVRKSMLSLGNPLQTLRKLHTLMGALCVQLETFCAEEESSYASVASSPQQFLNIANNNLSQNALSQLSSPFNMNASGSNEPSSTSYTSFKVLNLDGGSDRDMVRDRRPSVESLSGTQIQQLPILEASTPQGLYLNETYSLMLDRWEKVTKDFFNRKTGRYDLTKVPDVYDMIRYDLLHNSHLQLTGMEELYRLSSVFENSVVPQEYGTDSADKRYIGSKMCHALLEKIKHDLQAGQEDENEDMHYCLDHSHADDLRINSLGRCVRTRLYFTSESHLHTLLNVLRYPAEGDHPVICKDGLDALDNVFELSYLTQIVFRLFEDRSDPTRFHCEISMSPGATDDPVAPKTSAIAPYVVLNKSFNCQHLMDCLESAIALSKTNRDDNSNSGSCDDHSNDEGHESAGGSYRGDAHTSGGTHTSATSNNDHRHYRSSGITVTMDDPQLTSDRWERNEQGKLMGHKSAEKKKKKSKPSNNSSSSSNMSMQPPLVAPVAVSSVPSAIIEMPPPRSVTDELAVQLTEKVTLTETPLVAPAVAVEEESKSSFEMTYPN